MKASSGSSPPQPHAESHCRIRWFSPGFREALPEVLKHVRDWRLAAVPESYDRAAWVLAHGVRELITPDAPIKMPTLVTTSENDSGSTPNMSQAIAAKVIGAAPAIISELRHLGLLEDYKAFAVSA